MAKERPDAAHGGVTFGKRMLQKAVRAANWATGDYFTRRRVRCLAEGANGDCAQELIMRAMRGENVVPTLAKMVEKGGSLGANAAEIIGRLAKEGLRCTAAVGALEGRLYRGMEMEKSVASFALVQIGDEGALSALLLAYGSSDIKVRRAVDVAVCIESGRIVELARCAEPGTSVLCAKLLDRHSGGMGAAE